MVRADDTRRLREVNHAACVMVQRPQEEMLRSRIDDLTASSALPELDLVWSQLLERGSRTGHWPVVTGDHRVVEIDYSAVARSGGGLHLIVFVVRRMPSTWAPEATGGASPNGAPPMALSERETEVLRLTAGGLSGPEIARRLGIGPTTVKTHLQRAYRKLGVTDRAALVAEAMRRGLLS